MLRTINGKETYYWWGTEVEKLPSINKTTFFITKPSAQYDYDYKELQKLILSNKPTAVFFETPNKTCAELNLFLAFLQNSVETVTIQFESAEVDASFTHIIKPSTVVLFSISSPIFKNVYVKLVEGWQIGNGVYTSNIPLNDSSFTAWEEYKSDYN